MDELQISGKRFISARRIARENGYTSDYIGQLIRGGKISGQKVGRAWYVDSASFDVYLGTEAVPASLPVPAPTIEIAPEPAEIPAAPAVAAVPVAPEPEEMIVPIIKEPEQVVEINEPKSIHVVEATVSAEETPSIPAAVVEEIISEPEIITVSEPIEKSQYIPLRIYKKEESVGGLRYYADDTPALPEISPRAKESRVISSPEEAEEPMVQNKSGAMRHARLSPLAVGGLALLGIAVFAFSAVVSSAVTLNLSISEGNTAASFYSINW